MTGDPGTCESCGAPIVWATCDITGSRLPLNRTRVRTYELERTETGQASAALRMAAPGKPLLVYVPEAGGLRRQERRQEAGVTQNPRTTRELRLALWDAIGSVVAASGGNPGCTSIARQHAVVAVERAVDELLAERDRRIAELEAGVAELRAYIDDKIQHARFLRRYGDWHDDHGSVLWWRAPVGEPPYVGSPDDSDWPWEDHDEPRLVWLPCPSPLTNGSEWGDTCREETCQGCDVDPVVGTDGDGVSLCQECLAACHEDEDEEGST